MQPTTTPEKSPDEITLAGTTYKLQKLSGYRFIKIHGNGNKNTSDLYRDLIEACVIEPKLTANEAEELDYEIFVELAMSILGLHEEALKNLRLSRALPIPS